MTNYGKTKSGTVITNEVAEELAAEAERGYDDLSEVKRVGRPSLADGVSPRVNFRVAAAVYERARDQADREGKTLSELAREALERYVDETTTRGAES